MLSILFIQDNSLNDLDENDSNQLWTILHNFILEKSSLEENIQDKELLTCYGCILKLINHIMDCAENILCVYEVDYLLKSIIIFQTFYSKNFKYTVNINILLLCCILSIVLVQLIPVQCGYYQLQLRPRHSLRRFNRATLFGTFFFNRVWSLYSSLLLTILCIKQSDIGDIHTNNHLKHTHTHTDTACLQSIIILPILNSLEIAIFQLP